MKKTAFILLFCTVFLTLSFVLFEKSELVSYVENFQGIEETQLIDNVYPNPFEDELTIEFVDEAYYFIKFYDAQGRLVVSEDVVGAELKLILPSLSSGTYILQVYNVENRTFDVEKLVRK